MIKKFFVTLIACSAFLVSCNNDDDNGVSKETNIPVAERNALDDEAIQQYMTDFYFNPKNGRLTKFDDVAGNEDDSFPALITLAKKDEAGIWYAENPNHKGTGDIVESNDLTSIDISYNMISFRASNNTEYKKKYTNLDTKSGSGSINMGDGSAVKDPSFYYYIPSTTEASDGVKREYIEIKNLGIGLKNFKSTKRATTDLYNFQGVIILPSRLAYGRNNVYYNNQISDRFDAYRDVSYIFNFEIVKAEKRTK